ncbi:MAG: choice-of-anchor D domain-containing protein [Armatimonadetes bacterium]|nr:choice-of-anchor D domain-containing protein [Armatimonadota bacterium]
MGAGNTFASTDVFNYLYDEDPDYMIDELNPTPMQGTLYYTCQEGIGRGVYYDEGTYRTFCSSTVFGAMADGIGSNTKADLMARYFSFLSYDPEPQIWLADTEIDFGYQYLNYPETMTVSIRNLGYENLIISSIYVVGEAFAYTGATTFELGWGEIAEIDVTFLCASLGLFNGSLVIESNDPALSHVINLNGACIIPPEIELSQLELYAIVPPGQIGNDILTIFNNGGSNLEFSLIPTDTTPEQIFQNPQTPRIRKSGAENIINKDNSRTLPIYLELISSLRDSTVLFFDDMENGINNWTIEVYLPDDLWHQTETNFNSPTHSWWCGQEGTGTYNTGNQISTAVISPVIDLTVVDTTVTLQFFENYDTENGYDCCMVDVTTDGGITWIPLRGSLGNAPSGSSGGWITSVLDLTDYTGSEIKIRFYFDTTDSILNNYPGWFFDDVVVYYDGVPWLPIEPGSGTIPAGGSMDISITYDATDLEEGEYTADILVSSNDPADPQIIIPVTLIVSFTNTENQVIPFNTALYGNYPNPFNPSTTISFSTTESTENTELAIYNIKGQKVKTLVNEKLEAGIHQVVWNGKDGSNKSVSSGIYFYKMKSSNYNETKKMLLLE